MYTLELYDGTKLQGLERLNPVTFAINSGDPVIHDQLNPYNLSFALLFDEDDDNMLAGIFLDGMLQNYCNDGQRTDFRIGFVKDLMRESNKSKKKWNNEQRGQKK